jgi:uncharacterized Zn finger protein
MCKHVAAILYGVGSRLDEQPELLFRLHRVNESELIAKASKRLPLSKARQATEKILGSGYDLSSLFGLDIVETPVSKREHVRKSLSQVSDTATRSSNETPIQKAKKKPSSSRLKNDEQAIQE